MENVRVNAINEHRAVVLFHEGPVRFSFAINADGQLFKDSKLYKRLPPPSEQTARALDPKVRTNKAKIERALKIVREGDLIAKAMADKLAEEHRRAQEHRAKRAALMREALERFAADLRKACRVDVLRAVEKLREDATDEELHSLAFMIHEQGA